MSAPASRTRPLARRVGAAQAAVRSWWAQRPTRVHAQLAAELGGFASLTTAGFLAHAVVGFVVLGVVLLFVGNARW